MSGRLRIDSVRAEHFGGLTNVELRLPPASLVVIYGSNETGKSTLSELIAWLLVGPSTDGDVIRQYGAPDEALSGSLSGELRDEEFSASASFKVTPGGGSIAVASTREYNLGSLLTPEQWRQHIGGVDPQTLAGIYRLWGQQLHEGGDADTELRRAGLGALAGAADPRDLAKKFEHDARPSSKIGPGSSSFGSVISELADVVAEIREAERNVDDYRNLRSEIDQLESQRRDVGQRRSKLQERQLLLDRAGQLHALRRNEAEEHDRLDSCEKVTEKWELALDDLPAVHSTIKECRDARISLQEHEIEFEKRVAEAGVAGSPQVDEVLQRVTITIHDIAGIATAVADVSHAAKAVETAEQERREVATTRLAASNDLKSALQGISADEKALRVASFDADAQYQLVKLSDDFKSSLTNVEQAQAQLDTAQAGLVEAELALKFAVEGWDRFGLGIGPSEWLGRGVAARSSASMALWWTLIGVTVALGATAAVLGQWILVVLAVAALLISIKGRPTHEAAAHSTDLAAQAARVADAEREFDTARTSVAGRGEEVAAARQRVAQLASDLPRLSQRFGISIPDDPHKLRGALESWVEARKCLDRFDTLMTKAEIAEAKWDEAQKVESTRRNDLDQILTGHGLPTGLAPEAVESSASSYVEMAAAARSVVRCLALLSDEEDRLRAVLSPVANEIESWSIDRLSSHVELIAGHLKMLGDARSASESATKVVEAIVGDDLAFRALLDEGMTPDDREIETQRIAAEIAVAGEEVEETSEKLGLAADRLREVSRAERLADLRVREGSLIEARDDLALEAASRRLAGLLLRSVADDYEQKNQPHLVKRTGELAAQVADQWKAVVVKPSGANTAMLHVRMTEDGSSAAFDVAAPSLSTGARALLYLALRLSMAEQDGQKRGLDLPLICDDPLVHLDDERAGAAVQLLSEAAIRRQVLLFTCHQRTVDVATSAGAELVRLNSTD